MRESGPSGVHEVIRGRHSAVRRVNWFIGFFWEWFARQSLPGERGVAANKKAAPLFRAALVAAASVRLHYVKRAALHFCADLLEKINPPPALFHFFVLCRSTHIFRAILPRVS